MSSIQKVLAFAAMWSAAFALACQAVAETPTPRITSEDIVVATRADSTTPAVIAARSPTSDPAHTVSPEATSRLTATPLPAPTTASSATPAEPSLIATVTPNPTFEALRATPTPSTTASPTPAIDSARTRHVFRLPISNIVVPDPVFAYYGESSILHYEIFAGLTAFTTDETAPVELDMAASHSVSGNGLTHTFVLRPGLKFSDGSPVTASDFKWSWERALRVAAEVEVATQAEWVLAPIRGADEILTGEASELAGVAAVDETTLNVELTAPRSDLTALLAHPSAAVLKRENVEAWTVDWSTRVAGEWAVYFDEGSESSLESLPVGTGPFALTRFDEGNEVIIAERNVHYHGEPPQLDAVHFDAASNSEAWDAEGGLFVGLAQLFLEEKIDVIEALPSSFDESTFPSKLAPEAGNPSAIVLAFNPSIPPFDNLDFRRALAASIDTESLASVTGRDPATGIVPPESPGYSESSYVIAYDLDAAQSSYEAFAESNPGSIDPIRWSYGFSGALEPDRQAIIAGWHLYFPIRFDLKLESASSYQRLRRDNDLPLVIVDHAVVYPHPQASVIDFRQIFGDSVESDEIDRIEAMAAVAASEPDAVAALQLYGELEQYMLDNALVVPLWTHLGVHYFVRVQPWVHGYQIGRYGGPRFKDVWFDETYPGPTG